MEVIAKGESVLGGNILIARSGEHIYIIVGDTIEEVDRQSVIVPKSMIVEAAEKLK